MIKIKELKDNKDVNSKVISKLIEAVDDIESKIDCTGGNSLRIGSVYIEGKLCDLFLQFGYDNYFYALDNRSTLSKSRKLNCKNGIGNNLEEYKFNLKNYKEIVKDIKSFVDNTVKRHNDDIKNKENLIKELK